MANFPYQNREYIDWIRAGEFLTDTTEETAGNRVTPPCKMLVRDMAAAIAPGGGLGFDGADVIFEWSPDAMETKQADLTPANLEWFSLVEGTFTEKTWENLDFAEGWIRVRVTGYADENNVNLKVKTRPRVEKVI